MKIKNLLSQNIRILWKISKLLDRKRKFYSRHLTHTVLIKALVPFMENTADLTPSLTPFTRRVNRRKSLPEGLLQCCTNTYLWKVDLIEKSVVGKDAQATWMTAASRRSSGKVDSRSWGSFISSELRLESMHQEPSRTQMCSGNGLQVFHSESGTESEGLRKEELDHRSVVRSLLFS